MILATMIVGPTIDLTPLIPAINDLIALVGSLLVAGIPVAGTYAVMWLRNHNIQVKESTQKVIQDRLTKTVQNGIKYAEAKADAEVPDIKINVQDPKVAAAIQYIISQSPELLAKAKIDASSEEGQKQLERRVIAESQPAPAASVTPVPVVADVHLDPK